MLNKKKTDKRFFAFFAACLLFLFMFPMNVFGEALEEEYYAEDYEEYYEEENIDEEYGEEEVVYDAELYAEDGVAAAPDAGAVPADAAETTAAPEDVVIDLAAMAEESRVAAEQNAVDTAAPVTADNAGRFSGNAIGQWLDKTFYKFDYAIFTAFGSIHQEILTTCFNIYTHLGDTEVAIPCLLLGLILSFFKKTRKYGLTLMFAIVIGTICTNLVLKNVCGRARPYVTLSGDSQFMNWYREAGSNIESDNSFPSGHTTCAFEIATALFLTVRSKKVKWIFPLYAILIMCSRIYLMVHYPTDVLVGVVVGIAAGAVGYALCKACLKSEKIASFDLKEKFGKKKA